MTIDESIKINGRVREGLANVGRTEEAKAVGLGIEALKWVKDHRLIKIDRYNMLLPGETEK